MSLAFLLDMAWKSSAIAAAGLALVRLMRSRSAADRSAFLRLAVVTLLALPGLSLLLPGLRLEEALPEPFAALPLARLYAPNAMAEAFLVPAYLTGAAFMLVRLGAGVWMLDRWTRRAAPVEHPAWRMAAAAARGARVLVSPRAGSPLTWGVRRPVILIDAASHDRPDDAEAILAHESAHIARGDWVMLMLAQGAAALFWFNPLVWRLVQSLVHHSEEAADAQALGRVAPASYAQALVGCAGRRVPAAAMGMTAGAALKRRVGAVLDPRRRRVRSGSPWTRGAMAACLAFAGLVAALHVEPAATRSADPGAPAELVAALAAAGVRGYSDRELEEARLLGVDAAFVRAAAGEAGGAPSLRDLMRLRLRNALSGGG